MKIFLDDIRPTPDGWVRCFWPQEVIDLLKTGAVTEISLDHDLGDAVKAEIEGRKEITGKDVLNWLEEEVYFKRIVPPKMSIHSDNASGREAMTRAIKQIKNIYEQHQ